MCKPRWATSSGNTRQIQYGWRDIDIAAIAAQLVAAQDATILYGGQAMRADDKNMIDCLRKHADKVEIRIREKMSDALLSKARSILRDFADTSAVPEGEDKLIDCIQAKLEETQEHCQSLMHDHFTGLAPEFPYPGKSTIEDGLHVIGEILADRADGEAFLRAFNANGDKLLDFAEDMEPVDGFFPNQQRLFDGAVETLALMDRESFYLGDNEEAQQVIADMKGILRESAAVSTGERAARPHEKAIGYAWRNRAQQAKRASKLD